MASTMLELPGARGADGDTPASQDVEKKDGRFTRLARCAAPTKWVGADVKVRIATILTAD